MRYLMVVIAIWVLSLSAFAAEVNIGVDGCVILNDSTDLSTPSKIVVAFTLPDSLMDKEIVYAELSGWLALHSEGTDSLFEFRFYPLLTDWSVGQYDYVGIEAITDSMCAGLYTVRLGDSSAFYIDLTGYMMQLAQRERANYGQIATADLLGDNNIRLQEALGDRLRNRMNLKIIYR